VTPPTPTAALRSVADEAEVARAAADELVDAAARSLAERGRFTVALAGGTTPQRLYRLLADGSAPYRARVPWDRTHVFFGDERHVPPDNPDSNFRMARDALLAHVPVASVHRMRGELPDAAAAAASYETELERFFGLSVAAAPPPRLDLVLLGLGTDGHTASLFPGSAALEERRRWVAAPFVERLGTRRITLTLPVLERAREVVFLVSGREKADALARVLVPAETPLPAAHVRPEDGALVWIVDRAAAARVGRLKQGGVTRW
jgi:6-phosphogluconolactonase